MKSKAEHKAPPGGGRGATPRPVKKGVRVPSTKSEQKSLKLVLDGQVWGFDIPEDVWLLLRKLPVSEMKQARASQAKQLAASSVSGAKFDVSMLENMLKVARASVDPSHWDSISEAFAAIPTPSESRRLALWLMKFEEFRNLSKPGVARFLQMATTRAIGQNDHQFFRKLGDILRKPAQPFRLSTHAKEGVEEKLRNLLVKHWTADDEGTAQFCFLSDEATSQLLWQVSEVATSAESVRKMRRRLNLYRLTPAPIAANFISNIRIIEP